MSVKQEGKKMDHTHTVCAEAVTDPYSSLPHSSASNFPSFQKVIHKKRGREHVWTKFARAIRSDRDYKKV